MYIVYVFLCRENIYYIFSYSRRARGSSKLVYRKIKQRLIRKKNKKYPKRPKNHEEARKILKSPEIAKEFGFTLDNNSEFYADTVITPDHSFHVFKSHTTVKFIEEHIPPKQRNYLLDGTFSVVPKQFRQLLIICIEFMNDVRKKNIVLNFN